MIYLAAPYTSPDQATRNWRYQRARQALFGLWDKQQPAICPIVLGHEYECTQRTGPKHLPHAFWMTMARAQLSSCTHLYVLTIGGWDESDGVGQEVLLAHGMNRPVIGFAPFDKCADVSGAEILRHFGVPLPKRGPT
jgi:hypothetical protein